MESTLLYHRVYGKTRLSQLLEPFEVVTEEFRAKQASSRWQPVDRETALDVEGSASYYALGLFVLKLA